MAVAAAGHGPAVYLHRARAAAWSLHRQQQSTRYGWRTPYEMRIITVFGFSCCPVAGCDEMRTALRRIKNLFNLFCRELE